MALERNPLEYRRRAYGMDHNRYEWSMLTAVRASNGRTARRWRFG